MNARAPAAQSDRAIERWWLRLHRGLMPDYNRQAAVYWWVTVLIGGAVLVHALRTLIALPAMAMVQVGAGVAITVLAGLFPVRIQGSKNSFAAGEIFIFLLLLLHGPAAAALAGAGEALIGSWRTSKRWTSRLASPAIGCLAVFTAGSVFQVSVDAARVHGADGAGLLLFASMLCALLDFMLNTGLIAALPYLKRNQRPSMRELFGSFGWVGITFVGSASVACLLFLASQQSGIGVLMVAAPIIALMLATLHYHYRQQEADESVRKTTAEAVEREAELVANHVRQLEASEAKLQHIAFHDSLTGLPNRRCFQDHLSQMFDRARTDPQPRFALMFLDFDRFKLINDTLGHGAGDQFLVMVARRLQRQVRPSDMVGRLGGDEFAVLVEGMESEHAVIAMAERLQTTLREPYLLNGAEVNSSASIGITFSSIGYDTPDDVLRDADIAMYRAKSAGRARYAVFDAQLRAQVSERVQLEGDLRRAIELDQIYVVFQPICDLKTGAIVSFEALARWTHPDRGPISPGTFIPIAEESGLITSLTRRVLAISCRQLGQWRRQGLGQSNLQVQVNLSGIDLCNPSLADEVLKILEANALAASQLTLEITESTLVTRLDSAMSALASLREIGVGLSVDDFGTGYSSLSYLSTLPITALKIDRSFVSRMGTATKDSVIVKTIITLGRLLGKAVVAEGIETSDQLEQLRALGCTHGQGYLLGLPLDPSMARVLLESTPTPPSRTGRAARKSDALSSSVPADPLPARSRLVRRLN